MKIKKGDKVKITTGKDRGKESVVSAVLDQSKILLTGVNMFKRHLRPRGEGARGEIKEFSRAVSIGNLQLVCPKCNQTTRVGYRFVNDKKERFCKDCEQALN